MTERTMMREIEEKDAEIASLHRQLELLRRPRVVGWGYIEDVAEEIAHSEGFTTEKVEEAICELKEELQETYQNAFDGEVENLIIEKVYELQ